MTKAHKSAPGDDLPINSVATRIAVYLALAGAAGASAALALRRHNHKAATDAVAKSADAGPAVPSELRAANPAPVRTPDGGASIKPTPSAETAQSAVPNVGAAHYQAPNTGTPNSGAGSTIHPSASTAPDSRGASVKGPETIRLSNLGHEFRDPSRRRNDNVHPDWQLAPDTHH